MKTITATEFAHFPGRARTDQEVTITDRGQPTHVVVPYPAWRALVAMVPGVSALDVLRPKDALDLSDDEVDALFQRDRSELALPRVPDLA